MLFRFILFYSPFQFIAIYICRLRNYYYYPHLLPGSYCCCFVVAFFLFLFLLYFFDAHFMEQQKSKTSKDFGFTILLLLPFFSFPNRFFSVFLLILFLFCALATTTTKLFKCNLLISIFRS